jgi:hypothetical protein
LKTISPQILILGCTLRTENIYIMKNSLFATLIVILTCCTERATEQNTKQPEPQTTPIIDNSKTTDLFADSYFTFTNLDSLNERMLIDTTVKNDYKYIQSVKRFTKDHCKFFRTGCTDTFFDENVFFVSKQKKVGDFLPVIIHDSKDFGYYHSELFLLDTNYKKIDSLTVTILGSGTQSDEPSIYYTTEVISKFKGNKITTSEIEYWRYADNDSTVTVDSAVVYREIGKDGKIRLLKTDKII